MRTTLDLDDRVLAAARALARAEGVSLGRAVSSLALEGLRPLHLGSQNGFPVFDRPADDASRDHVITDELVEQHRDDG